MAELEETKADLFAMKLSKAAMDEAVPDLALLDGDSDGGHVEDPDGTAFDEDFDEAPSDEDFDEALVDEDSDEAM